MQRSIILLCGLPRSGTTWVGKVFDSHPDTLYLHEPDSAHRFRQTPVAPPVDALERHRAELEGYLAGLARVRSTKVNASLPVFPKRYYSPLALSARKAMVFAAKLGAKAFGEFPLAPSAGGGTNPPIVWKSIESVGRLGLLARLPQMTCVHILRHPCGYVASVKRGDAGKRFEDRDPSSEDLEYFALLLHTEQAKHYGITLEALEAMPPVERMAWRWVLLNEKAMEDCAGLTNCHPVRYEDLCAHPLEGFRELFRYAGLAWNAQTERFIGASTSSEDDAYYAIYKNPIESAMKWRKQLSSEEIRQILAVVAQTKVGRFYPADYDPLTARPLNDRGDSSVHAA